MLRLVDSSEPNAVTRFNVQAHYTQRLVLSSAVCHELKHAAGEIVGRPRAALELLGWWMRSVYDLPKNRDVNYAHGLDDPLLTKYASDVKGELVAGARVCAALAMAFTADKEWELESDMRDIRNVLDAFLRQFDR